MRCKWFFRNERREMLLKHPSLREPAKEAPALELFLSQSEKDILSILPGKESTCF